jgi:hypothetical protein
MTFGRFLLAAASLAILSSAAAQAASKPSWNGTWIGLLNNSEPVSITIANGRVVSYAIRGGQPFGIGYSQVTLKTVSFGDHDNYDVRIIKTSETTAAGSAHSPLGDGEAILTRR